MIEVCQRYFSQLGRWDDPRLTVLIEDACQYISSTSEVFDVIIMDSTDPLPHGVAEPLFSPEFFEQAFHHLSPQGIMVSQMEPPFFDVDRVKKLWEGFNVFPIVKLYWGLVPTYPGGIWSYVIASKSQDPRQQERVLIFPLVIIHPYSSGCFCFALFFRKCWKIRKEMKKTLAKVATLYLLEQAGSVGDSKGPLFLPVENCSQGRVSSS